eukprot:9823407-Alexandrium_andersonii.AAC.1
MSNLPTTQAGGCAGGAFRRLLERRTPEGLRLLFPELTSASRANDRAQSGCLAERPRSAPKNLKK